MLNKSNDDPRSNIYEEQRPWGRFRRFTLNQFSTVKLITVNPGQVFGLLGPNGAGKTTSFYMITGMIRPNEGKVYFDNQDVTNTPMYRRARMGMGYLAQEPSIFTKLSVSIFFLSL